MAHKISKAELVQATRTLEQLKTIEFETHALSNDFPILATIWESVDTVQELEQAYQHLLDSVNGVINTSYEVHAIGEYAYTWTQTEQGYTRETYTRTEVYKPTVLTLFKTVCQCLAYSKYGVVDDLRRVQAQEQADHIQYLLDIGCTEQDLIRAGLLDVTLPLSACEQGYTNLLYSN